MTVDRDYTVFAIISEPRTGSTALSSKLRSISGVNCQGEVFHPDEIFCGVAKDSIPDISERNRKPIPFLDKLVEQVHIQKDQPSQIGFKIFFDHNTTVIDHLLKTKTPILVLERADKLAQYSSLEIAKKTGQWQSGQKLSKEQEERNKRQGKKVGFSMLKFVAFSVRSRYRFSNLNRKIRRHGGLHHYMTYETMFEDEEWKKIVNFLRIRSANIDVVPVLKKQNPGSVFDRFDNPGYAYNWCRFALMLPWLPKILHITPELIGRSRGSVKPQT